MKNVGRAKQPKENAGERQAPEPEYSRLLDDLSRTHREIALVLTKAERSRTAMLRQYRSGARLQGLNELLQYLNTAKNVFDDDAHLTKISFLISRARDDFEVAIEAALSGARGVVADQMRDVMEIEFLLRDFRDIPARIDDWLTESDQERYNHFRPAILRQRHAAKLGLKPQDVAEAVDYKAHSGALHVTPRQIPLAHRGLAGDDDQFKKDVCFWEIFEDGRRLLFQIHELKRKVAPKLKGAPSPRTGLKAFREAWQRTQEMQTIFFALLEASTEVSEGDPNDQAAPSEDAGEPQALTSAK